VNREKLGISLLNFFGVLVMFIVTDKELQIKRSQYKNWKSLGIV